MREIRFALRLQPSLMEELRKVAEMEGVALNQLINVAVAEKVSALRTGENFLERGRRADRRLAVRRRLLRWNQGLVPRGRVQRFTVAIDRRFHIAPKVGVQGGCRSVFPGQTQGFGKQSDMRFGGTDHGDGPLIAFDDDLRASAHHFQQLAEIAGSFGLRYVDYMVGHEVIISCRSMAGG
jgi:hypothetical protein